MTFGSNSRSLGSGASRAGHAGGIAALSAALALTAAQAVGTPARADAGTSNPGHDPLEAVHLGVTVLEQLDQLVTDTRQAIAQGGPADTGFARIVSDVDAVYQATLGRVTGFEEFAFTLDFALIGGQTLDLTSNPDALTHADLADGDLLIGTTREGEPLELALLGMDVGWTDIETFVLDEEYAGLDFDPESVEMMGSMLPRMAVIEADIIGPEGIVRGQAFLLIERSAQPGQPSQMVAMPIGTLPEWDEEEQVVEGQGGPIVVPGAPPRKPRRIFRDKTACFTGIALSVPLGVICLACIYSCPVGANPLSCACAATTCCGAAIGGVLALYGCGQVDEATMIVLSGLMIAVGCRSLGGGTWAKPNLLMMEAP